MQTGMIKTIDHYILICTGQVCIISGWGSINPEGNIWGPTLKQEYAQLWTNQECGEAYQPEWVTDR